VTLRSYELHGITMPSANTPAGAFRLMLVLDKQSNGATPGWTDILVQKNVYSPRNLANRKRFKIMWNKLIATNSTTCTRALKMYMRFKKRLVTDYNAGNAGDITDVATNALFFIVLGTYPNAGDHLHFHYYGRLRYQDN